MVFEEMLKDEFANGHKLGREEGQIKSLMNCTLEVLKKFEPLDKDLRSRIERIDDPDVLGQLFSFAVNAESAEQFRTQAEHLLSE
jgi:hypothetical protein